MQKFREGWCMQIRRSLFVRAWRRRIKKQSRPTDTAATSSAGTNGATTNDVPQLHDGLLDDDDANAGIPLLSDDDGSLHRCIYTGAENKLTFLLLIVILIPS